MNRNFASRIVKLEQFRRPAERQYVYHVSDPRTADENEAIAKAVGPIIIVPHPCKTVDEWIAKHAPRGALQ